MRKNKIYGRVVNTLQRILPSYDEIESEIYDRMQQAQDEVISITQLEREFDITLIDGQSDYNLVINSKKIVGEIKSIVRGTNSVLYPITIIGNSEWDETINNTISSSQPLYATIFDNKIKLYPTPNSDVAGLKLTIICKMNGTNTEVVSNVSAIDLEIPSLFDLAIEYFTIAHLLDQLPQQQAKYFQLFNNQIELKKGLALRKYSPLQTSRNW